MNFNPHLLLLFGNAFLTTVLSVAIVAWILVREYRPTIKRLTRENESSRESEQPAQGADALPHRE
ncbi:hypothetical protein [Halomonas elongata]|uniref:Uncharacterized protein n=1 Tax=Halomonas elongata (strain ATCC 33173 / DSM 2581 / NBRC 15536 / NCIMB 2198 / 1H9) TaxID=768066 RepID=E1V5J1_HALED|nr:hypothetical protein [Halomonas elongata]MDL4863087.1 hypothetical protein [Halomonas elongata]WBF16886.1 hypothetical protein LM502_12390 [Halomonas elongata]WPU45717.1 hypothetical protein SR933_10615 [Halomonas elongata DSM 2581]CBV43146.1 uncharacterized protein HELO_3262 [Halomonas elongata DSM 2581]